MTAPTLPDLTNVLTRQWTRLERWLEPLGDDLLGAAAQPSVLPGWTRGELVSHLGRCMGSLTAAVPQPAGTRPVTLSEYLGGYKASAEHVTTTTRELDERIAGDRLAEVSRLVGEAFAHLRTLGDGPEAVVLGNRAPLRLRDLVVTRLVELVVHADDVARSFADVAATRGADDPVDREALALVADELCGIVRARGGWDLEVADARLWVRLAAGRVPYDVDELAVALRTSFTADSVPDLGNVLPLV